MISLTDQPDLPLEQGELGLATDDSLLAPVAASDLPPPGENDCRVCGAQVGPDQDWCLECGAAVAEPRRIPGLATVALAGVFTLVLAGGAVAAGVAALNDTTPPRDTKVETVAEELPETPAIDDNLSSDPLSPDSGAVDDSLTPVEPLPAPEPTPTPTPTPTPEPKPISVVGAETYDPKARIPEKVTINDPGYAIGKKKTPSMKVTLLDGGGDVFDAGIEVKLGKLRNVKRLTFTTTERSAGFSIRVYGSRTAAAPDEFPGTMKLVGKGDSIDAAKAKGDASNPDDVAGDEKYELALNGSEKFRTIVIWFVKPPKDGDVASMSQLKFFDD